MDRTKFRQEGGRERGRKGRRERGKKGKRKGKNDYSRNPRLNTGSSTYL